MKEIETVSFCGTLWEKGQREKNEDSLAFWHMKKGKKNQVLAIICDGIGGLQEGEQASSYVVRKMADWFMLEGYKIRQSRKKTMRLQQMCYQIHEELRTYGKEKGIRLGTTMTMLLLDNQKVIWAHCGDCRLYLIRRKKVRKLTEEQCEKNGAINRALGAGEWHLVSMGTCKVKREDTFLLCTDGFYRNLNKEELQIWAKREIKDDTQAERMLKQIFQKKVSMGEKDNISAIYFGVGKKGKEGVG